MSVIVHRCVCGHTQANHGTDTNKFTPKGCTGAGFGPPELIATFDKHGRRVNRIVPPGDWDLMKNKACSCADCRSFYDRQMSS